MPKRKLMDDDDVVVLSKAEMKELVYAQETLNRLLPKLVPSEEKEKDDRSSTPGMINIDLGDSSTNNLVHRIQHGSRIYTRASNGDTTLRWKQKPKTVLIIKKPGIPHISTCLSDIAIYLFNECDIKVMVQPTVLDDPDSDILPLKFLQTYNENDMNDLHNLVDFIICLGGDGTILFTSNLFNGHIVPPVVSFALGTLGFLTPFNFENFKEVLNNVMSGNIDITTRARLRCTVQRHISKEDDTKEVNDNHQHNTDDVFHCLNEVMVSRVESNMTDIDLNIDGIFFTKVLADGLIVSTPTGSTAYSLSAGGNVVHPTVPCVLLTPVCPHSLSFRPLVIPDTLPVELISRHNKSQVSFDGRDKTILYYGDSVTVTHSRSFVPLICHGSISQDWHDRITRILSWNSRGGSLSDQLMMDNNRRNSVTSFNDDNTVND